MVYRQEKYPEFRGMYLFADNQAGLLFVLDPRSPGARTTVARTQYLGQNGITSISTPPGGDIIVTALGSKKAPNGLVAQLRKGGEAGMSADQGQVMVVSIADKYDMQCSRCHGIDGKGAGAQALSSTASDFTDPLWKTSTPDSALREIIIGGGVAVGKSAAMPAWKGVFTDQELDELIAYIKSM